MRNFFFCEAFIMLLRWIKLKLKRKLSIFLLHVEYLHNNVENKLIVWKRLTKYKPNLPTSQMTPVHPGSQIQVYWLISSWHWPFTQGKLAHSLSSTSNENTHRAVKEQPGINSRSARVVKHCTRMKCFYISIIIIHYCGSLLT